MSLFDTIHICACRIYLERVAASSVTRGAIDDTETLAVNAIGAGNSNERAVSIYRGDGRKGEEDSGEDRGLGEHDGKNVELKIVCWVGRLMDEGAA